LLHWLAGLQRETTRLPALATRLSDADEIRIGNAMAARVRVPTATGDLGIQAYTPDDPAIHAYIERVGARLAAHARRKLPYKFHYLPDINFVNAFALPGGQIFIGAGLIEFMDTEDGLAAVLGHEVEHIDHYHCAERAQVESRLQKIPLGGLVQLPIALFQAGYTKDEELEADREGTRLAGRAGYSPMGALRMFQTFDRLSHEQIARDRTPQGELSRLALQTLSGYFQSHPHLPERIAQVQEMIVNEHWENLSERNLEIAAAFRPNGGDLSEHQRSPTRSKRSGHPVRQ
jgi:predicted Zn-dependent protease